MAEKKRRARSRSDRRREIGLRLLAAAAVITVVSIVIGVTLKKKASSVTRPETAAGVVVESMRKGAYSLPEEPETEKEQVPPLSPDGSSGAEDAETGQAAADEIVYTDTSGDWRLILVNPKHMLPEDFEVETCSIWDGEPEQIDRRIYDELHAMLDDCESAGFNPVIRSSFRTYNQQLDLYESKTEEYMAEGESYEEAKTDAASIVAIPGTSEHQLGLALDIVSGEYGVLNSAQADNPTQQWLMENSWKYGFILRYPTDKGDITGIIFEPWHYRYVGKEHAEAMHDMDLCLEEYLEKYGNEGLKNGQT